MQDGAEKEELEAGTAGGREPPTIAEHYGAAYTALRSELLTKIAGPFQAATEYLDATLQRTVREGGPNALWWYVHLNPHTLMGSADEAGWWPDVVDVVLSAMDGAGWDIQISDAQRRSAAWTREWIRARSGPGGRGEVCVNPRPVAGAAGTGDTPPPPEADPPPTPHRAAMERADTEEMEAIGCTGRMVEEATGVPEEDAALWRVSPPETTPLTFSPYSTARMHYVGELADCSPFWRVLRLRIRMLQ